MDDLTSKDERLSHFERMPDACLRTIIFLPAQINSLYFLFFIRLALTVLFSILMAADVTTSFPFFFS